MKNNRKWWDNPNKTEVERRTESFAIKGLIWCAVIFLVLTLLTRH